MVVRPVKLVCVSSRQSVIRVTTSKAVQGHRSTLEKAVKVAVRGFFDSGAGKMTRHERQAIATNQMGCRSGRSPLTGYQCSPHSVNGYHPRRELTFSTIIRSPG